MIIAVCLVAAIVLLLVAYFTYWNHDVLSFICVVLGVIAAVSTIVMSVCAIYDHVGAQGYAAACHERYESLVYQAEAEMYNNDNEIGKKELMNQIQRWNEDLAIGKARQRDLWVGVFYPNIYDDFDFIPPDLVK